MFHIVGVWRGSGAPVLALVFFTSPSVSPFSFTWQP
jgi:hypothetical protein